MLVFCNKLFVLFHFFIKLKLDNTLSMVTISFTILQCLLYLNLTF